MPKFFLKIKGGYTIIETMIAVSLFVIIIMTGMGALLNANLLHKKSQSMRSIMDNLSFIMEDISRNLRIGYNYYCITGNDNLSSVDTAKSGQSCWGIAFEYATGDSVDTAIDGDPIDHNDQWVYYIGTNGIDSNIRIFKSIQGPYIQSSFIQLTPDEVVIDPVSSFSVLGAEAPNPDGSGDHQQPFVIIRLVGSITFKNVVTPFSLQTSVSQRVIDI
jgi:type II secretory pathway pseudopilin PulG